MKLDNLEKKLEVLFDLAKYEELLALAIENLYQNKSDELLLYTFIILAHINLKNYDKALNFCDESIGKYPDNPYLFQLRAKVYFLAHKNKQALKNINQSLQLDPNDADSYLVTAKLFLEKNDYVEAKKEIDKALAIDASNLDFHIVNAVCLYMLDGEHVAQDIIEEVLQKEPNNEYALYVKQEFFSSNLHAKKSMLKNLLFLNPFDKEYQADLQFIKNYYRYIPALMFVMILLVLFIYINRNEYGFLGYWLALSLIIVSIIGSNDWRFNIPFLTVLFGISTYFSHIPDGFEVTDFFIMVFLSVVHNYIFMAMFMLAITWKNKLVNFFMRFKNA